MEPVQKMPLFWKREETVPSQLILQDTGSGLAYSITASDGRFVLTEIGSYGGVINPFTLTDIVTGRFYKLVLTDGAVYAEETETGISVVSSVPLTDLVTGEQFQLYVIEGAVSVSDAPLAEIYGLANLIPLVYTDSDKDGSLQSFIKVYDDQHTEQRKVLESLADVRIPSKAPLRFILNIADALGSPFPFMSDHRWKRGNKLAALPFIYTRRGSQQGLEDAIRYLCGIDDVQVVDYTWVLGVSRFPG